MNEQPQPPAATAVLSEAERLARLRLIRSQNVGPVTFRQLLARFGSGEKALAALPDLARRGGRTRAIKICSKAAALAEFEQIARLGGSAIIFGEADYPATLAATEDAPAALFALGHRHLLARRMLAIVGARNASAAGVLFARQISAELGRAGLTIVSGLARGIDAAAHQGSLATGTTAVVAGGVDVVYPPENRTLYEEIVETGLVISEMPAGTRPQARHFPRRNRIISGLSLGVLVVEAAPRSGSLITAGLALEQGREVFAVPGSPLDPRSRGANNLIRQGATLTDHADDVIRALEGMAGRMLREPARRGPDPVATGLDDDRGLDRAREILRQKLSPTAITVDELVRQCNLTPGVVLTILLELELAGSLQRQSGNKVSLI